jgi:hypothetical protein
MKGIYFFSKVKLQRSRSETVSSGKNQPDGGAVPRVYIFKKGVLIKSECAKLFL